MYRSNETHCPRRSLSEASNLHGKGVTPSIRRARELYQRAIELGAGSQAVKNMQTLTNSIQEVS